MVKGKTEPIDIYECFDGDQTEQKNLKKQAIEPFSAGMKAYWNRDFHSAIVQFEKVLKFNESDTSAKIFLEKARHFNINTPNDNWTGIMTMKDL